jgi:hypothetical protein
MAFVFEQPAAGDDNPNQIQRVVSGERHGHVRSTGVAHGAIALPERTAALNFRQRHPALRGKLQVPAQTGCLPAEFISHPDQRLRAPKE